MRMRLLPVSATYTSPLGAMTAAEGLQIHTLMPCMLSPLEPHMPVPSMVVMVPVVKDTRRTMLAPPSTTSRSWPHTTAKPVGRLSCADLAGPPSPMLPMMPVPANRLVLAAAAFHRRTRELPSLLRGQWWAGVAADVGVPPACP